jgi:DNA-binding HxlR family transcriptional regulator
MPYRAFEDQNCSIARTLAIVGERWTLLIMRELLLGRRRFEELRRNTGVATNILSDRLATLVEHGLVVHHGEPPQYTPTAKGRDLVPVLVALMTWGDRYTAPEAGPPQVPVHATCGHDAGARLHCGHCGEPIAPREIQVRPGPGASKRQQLEPLLP